ncbi:efflux transporter outer membrane subunit [Sphingomonas nostoxanthinifaciens]|uniref:efflux transporter outer membrane subunit n=1 Tax=Sphingomonas nostoxanthinifaciens TaxID=2872652 RepID=UPI001CC1E5CD|nr:efflux transporter outer membrane subunit [Sphingomonas nostoxanthinifaciens]UAK25062.1 efflux transporter outer membrane subunit [Sphingomonas nostoxanthinifaciens]
MRRFACVGALALAGCTVGPNFERPKPAAPAAYGTEPQDVTSRTYAGEVDTAWWKSFGDPELTALVDRLGKQNLDLQSAAERIGQARAQRTIAASLGLPHAGGRATYTHERESANGTASLVEPAPGAPLEFDLYQPQVQASWELDLFGKVRRAVEAASARTQAEIEARNGIALSAVAELAQDYLMLRQLQAQDAVLRDNLAAARRRVGLTRDRFASGVATTLDVAQAEAQATEIAQSLPSLRNQEAAMENAVAFLLAEPPRALADELGRPAAQPPVPPAVPVGLPGELMRRRPDIRQAEAELHAATADTGVAVANFFPSISLGGNFGTESLHTGTIFDWASRAFMLGPTVNIPFFQGGQLKGTLALRKSQQRAAAIAYQQAVLRGWHDVDNALTGYAEAQHERDNAAATVAAERRALAAAEDQYASGVATQLDVISAQGALFQAEDGVVRAQAQVEIRLVTLYKALGGGWSYAATTP